MKTTAEMIAVMQAFERGEKIEIRDVDEESWGNLVVAPSWNWRHYDYRIKPREPRVIWVNEYAGAGSAYHDSEEFARKCAEPNATRIAVKYIEVIE